MNTSVNSTNVTTEITTYWDKEGGFFLLLNERDMSGDESV